MLRIPLGSSGTVIGLGRPGIDSEVATAIAIARRLRPPMKLFAYELRRELGLKSLSRQAVYAWERGDACVPAAALVAAAKVSATSIDQLLALARRLDEMGLRPGD
jgi:hypothetical protein